MQKKKGQTRRRILRWLLILLCLVAFITSIFMIASHMKEYADGADAYDRLTHYVSFPKATSPQHAEGAIATSAPAGEEEVYLSEPSVAFDALAQVNSDIVAWIICEDTRINYPVVQGKDNSYYLTHLINGESNKVGCLFVDINNSPGFVDDNTIIYGHNMKDKSMFATLMEYKKQTFYDAHPTMQLLTPEGNYTIVLFAGYVADIQDSCWNLWYSDDAAFAQWLADAKQHSTFQSAVTVSTTDRFITLSTCTYEFDNARYVLIGKLIPA